jgi:mRNA-degrading endonuclease YafQ of YafQ-DinJ toxin-antitoxin module
MWRLGRTATFARTARRFLRRRQPVHPHFQRVLEILERDPFDPRLHTHPLSGKLEGLHAVRVTYSIRLVVRLDPEEREVVLLDLGEHDDVYR